jgi:hypothetical protein
MNISLAETFEKEILDAHAKEANPPLDVQKVLLLFSYEIFLSDKKRQERK